MSVRTMVHSEHEGRTRWFVQVDVPDNGNGVSCPDRCVEFIFLSRIEAQRFTDLLEQAVSMIVI